MSLRKIYIKMGAKKVIFFLAFFFPKEEKPFKIYCKFAVIIDR